ncbi:hypothetical protein DOS58_00725 [Staphylococcus felis]|nr:hypothetical protein DOS61_01695 [Staphylococcus felis]REH92665.1 hypothetical protein DOS58_00725 [Staphylococcus felis]
MLGKVIKYNRRNDNIKSKYITLKDNAYAYSQSSLSFVLRNSLVEEGERIYYFDVFITVENIKYKLKIALFDSDFDNLKGFKYGTPISECYFIEPDFHLTVLHFGDEDLVVYVNVDSGLRYANVATESGIAIKLNVTKDKFDHFINQLLSINDAY